MGAHALHIKMCGVEYIGSNTTAERRSRESLTSQNSSIPYRGVAPKLHIPYHRCVWGNKRVGTQLWSLPLEGLKGLMCRHCMADKDLLHQPQRPKKLPEAICHTCLTICLQVVTHMRPPYDPEHIPPLFKSLSEQSEARK